MSGCALPDHFEQSVDLDAPAERVFEYLDDFERLGEHMTRPSGMMAGGRMRYEFDAARGRSVGSIVRITGKLLGIAVRIEQRVAARQPPLSKYWETFGPQRMLVIAAYRLGFALSPSGSGCRLTVSIDYSKPRTGLGRWLGKAAGDRYAQWCVSSMINTGFRHFGSPQAIAGASP